MDNFGSLETYKDIVTTLNEARSAPTFAKALETSLDLYLSFTKFEGGVVKIETSASAWDISCEISRGAAKICPNAFDLPDCLCGGVFPSKGPQILAASVLGIYLVPQGRVSIGCFCSSCHRRRRTGRFFWR